MTHEEPRPDHEEDLPLEYVSDGPLLPLPGHSTEYEIYLFRCGVCGAESTMMFMDTGETPLCGSDPDHGATTWVR